MLLIKCREMRAIDKYAIENLGIPSVVLMENAALKVIKNIDLKKTPIVLLLYLALVTMVEMD